MEIGSEFEWNPSYVQEEITSSKEFDYSSDVFFTFSGRTAIETVLRNEPQIKKVLFPTYCCKSMMEPFLERGIDIDFYSVNFNNELNIDIPILEDVDAILWCNYFGYHLDMPDFSEFRMRGGIVIEDITHSMLSSSPSHSSTDYIVGSLRKWGPFICGGVCKSRKGTFKVVPEVEVDCSFAAEKSKAMKDKSDYLSGNTSIAKSDFLRLFNKSNDWLASHYSNRKIDDASLSILSKMNFEDIREQRIRNSIVLHEGLSSKSGIEFLFGEQYMDCPLFVPIIVDSVKRDSLRSFLIENEVYCPVHWPKPFDIMDSDIYDRELSLICDQRYKEVDMIRIVDLINQFMTQN